MSNLMVHTERFTRSKEPQWLPAPGTRGLYEISDRGDLRTAIGGRGRKVGRVHAKWTNSKGYVEYKIVIDGKNVFCRAHRLVALAFLGEPTGPLIRHLDGDRLNNRVENLAYGTSSENVKDSMRHGTYRNGNAMKTVCRHGHPYSPENTYWVRGIHRRCKTCEHNRYVRRVRPWEAIPNVSL